MTRPPKQRADLLLVALGLAESRARAQALILAGKVFSDTKRVEKAGDLLADGAPLEVRGQDHPWVSRGGLKLAHALTHFGLNPAGLVCLDLGASTGGFTDVLLQHGAAKVYAVDVGQGRRFKDFEDEALSHWRLVPVDQCRQSLGEQGLLQVAGRNIDAQRNVQAQSLPLRQLFNALLHHPVAHFGAECAVFDQGQELGWWNHPVLRMAPAQ